MGCWGDGRPVCASTLPPSRKGAPRPLQLRAEAGDRLDGISGAALSLGIARQAAGDLLHGLRDADVEQLSRDELAGHAALAVYLEVIFNRAISGMHGAGNAPLDQVGRNH